MELFKKLFFKDTLISIYKDEEKEYYMTGEDIGRCLGYSNPRIQFINYFKSHFDISDPMYARKEQLSNNSNHATWCFTALAIKDVARYRGNIALKEWAESVFMQLQNGYFETESETMQMELTRQSETERRRAAAITKQSYSDNKWRADFLLNYADLCYDPTEIEKLKSAAMTLFRGAPLSEVQEKYLKSYGEFYAD